MKQNKNINLNELKQYLVDYQEKNGCVPHEVRKEIEKYIQIEKARNKIFATNLLKSKWFNLGIIETIRKGQADRISINGTIIYEWKLNDVVLNLVDLTIKANNKKKFDLATELNKLNTSY